METSFSKQVKCRKWALETESLGAQKWARKKTDSELEGREKEEDTKKYTQFWNPRERNCCYIKRYFPQAGCLMICILRMTES